MKAMKCKDGYALYEQLKDGANVEVDYGGKNYGFVFVGERTGTRNYLSVTDSNGEEKRFGRGWGSEQVWRALAHLEAGWSTKQTPPYRHYDESEEEEGGLAY
jgi:hypothetical protein